MSSSSSSNNVEDQSCPEALSCVVDEAIAMVKAEMQHPSTRPPMLHCRYINRDREVAYERLYRDYFVDDCAYSPT
jgi:hypothetical protein